jgi:hypothetical protein
MTRGVCLPHDVLKSIASKLAPTENQVEPTAAQFGLYQNLKGHTR